MKQRRLRILFLLTALVLAFSVLSAPLASCSSCSSESYAATHLAESYGVPAFNQSKVETLERFYRDHYITNIPPASVMAEKTAAYYFENYHEKIDTGDAEAVTNAIIRSYVKSVGDKFSVYREPAQYDDYHTDLSGTYYDIGVEITYDHQEKTATVSGVLSGGGAEAAGIRPGDIILAVNGELLSDFGYTEVEEKLRGDLDTTVALTVIRNGAEITFYPIRREIEEALVYYAINENKIGYIYIDSFKTKTFGQFKEAVDFMEENGAVGIIYDLRSNPGGYLSSVNKCLSYIAPNGTTIASYTNNYSAPTIDNDPHSMTLPSVVICDGRTASAGELFVAAMRDFDDTLGLFEVTTVGVTTYGKGVMQSTYSLGDGSTITMTIAYYNPPCGVNYHGIGVIPDVEVFLEEEGDLQLDTAYAEIYKMIK